MKPSKRERVQYILQDKGITEISKICPRNDKMYMKLYRQITTGDSPISIDVLDYIADNIPGISAEYLYRGEGTMYKSDAPTNITRQDIHLAEGATAAISQSGEATVESAPADNTSDTPSTFTPADVARMLRDGDTAGLVGIILQQQATIEQMKDEQISKLNQLLSYFDTKTFDMFQDPK